MKNSMEFPERTTGAPKGSTRWPMRQVAHFCVTLRHSRERKDTEIDAFRASSGRKSVVESPKWRKSLPPQRFRRMLQMLQKCSIVAHSVHSAAAREIRPAGLEIRRKSENSSARHLEKSAKCLKNGRNLFSGARGRPERHHFGASHPRARPNASEPASPHFVPPTPDIADTLRHPADALRERGLPLTGL
jgi:hypothetical protein